MEFVSADDVLEELWLMARKTTPSNVTTATNTAKQKSCWLAEENVYSRKTAAKNRGTIGYQVCVVRVADHFSVVLNFCDCTIWTTTNCARTSQSEHNSYGKFIKESNGSLPNSILNEAQTIFLVETRGKVRSHGGTICESCPKIRVCLVSDRLYWYSK